MGGYRIAPESLRAHKSYVFMKQQKLRKREGAWKEKETEVNKVFSGLQGIRQERTRKTKCNESEGRKTPYTLISL